MTPQCWHNQTAVVRKNESSAQFLTQRNRFDLCVGEECVTRLLDFRKFRIRVQITNECPFREKELKFSCFASIFSGNP